MTFFNALLPPQLSVSSLLANYSPLPPQDEEGISYQFKGVIAYSLHPSLPKPLGGFPYQLLSQGFSYII